MKLPPTIDNMKILREKLNLLDVLRDIEVAYKYINLGLSSVFINLLKLKGNLNRNPLDSFYLMLKT